LLQVDTGVTSVQSKAKEPNNNVTVAQKLKLKAYILKPLNKKPQSPSRLAFITLLNAKLLSSARKLFAPQDEDGAPAPVPPADP